MVQRGSLHLTTAILLVAGLAGLAGAAWSRASADEPKPKPENTISIQLGDPVPPQKFAHPPKFWIADVIDRSGNPQPMLVMKERGGVFLEKQPTAIVREALEQSLKAANLMAADAASADLVLRVYLFHFGLAAGSGLDFFGKVEFSTIVKNPKTGESQEVKAAGTSIAKGAVRKKNLQKNVQEDIEEALHDATRNFLRGTQLKEAVAALWDQAVAVPAAAPAKEEASKPSAS
ncbi:MAG TPA: hypothetical protein VEG63_02510 [Candidatus Acidoferrales bacterium]|nr:hypothetical protein [Candidatus Acidoferrales bacterium]